MGASATTIQIQTSALTSGQTYNFYATATNGVNTSSCSTATVAYTYDGDAPAVTNITSTDANGTYSSGTIAITITFSETVVVTGSPLLALNTSPSRNATYASGSGTNTLTFNYIITNGDGAVDLDYASVGALTLNGGTIKDAAARSATLALPIIGLAGSLGVNKNIEVAATTPDAPGNFFATTEDGQIYLSWNSCAGCTYNIYWSTSPGVTTSSNAIEGVTANNYVHSGLTNGTLYYYRIRATRAGVGSSGLSSEVKAMPYSNICTSGDLRTTCTISSAVTVPNDYIISGVGNIIIANGENLKSNSGQNISLNLGGSLTVQN